LGDHLLYPVIFAGYSNENVLRYNIKLRDKIITRTLDIFDYKKIIDSFFNLKIVNKITIE